MKIPRTIVILSFLAFLLSCSERTSKTITMNKNDPSLAQRGKYLYFKDKPAEGMIVEYYASGKLKSKTLYKNGLMDGPSKSWYEEGEKESVRFYLLGEKQGLHLGWWPNGNPKFQYQFTNGSYHGSFKEWYENGKLLHLFEYNHGAEVSAIGWRENGKTYINFSVRNGRKYGLTNSRLCFSLKDEQGVYQSTSNN